MDHHTKFVNCHPLHAKCADEVLSAVQNYCFFYRYPKKKILTDNGGKFANAKLKSFCKDNQIELSLGAPRKPTNQGLVERSNRTWKEDIRAIILSSKHSNIDTWCQHTMEASYTMNITYHRAIKTTPYEAVFGIQAHRENVSNSNENTSQLPNNQDDNVDLSASTSRDESETVKREPNVKQFPNIKLTTTSK